MEAITELELAPLIIPHIIGECEATIKSVAFVDNIDSGDVIHTRFNSFQEDNEPSPPEIDRHVNEFIKIRNVYGLEINANHSLDESTINAASEKFSLDFSLFGSK